MINRIGEHLRCFGLALRKYGSVVLMSAMLVVDAGSMTTIAKAAEARDTVKKGTLEIRFLRPRLRDKILPRLKNRLVFGGETATVEQGSRQNQDRGQSDHHSR